MGNSCCFRRGSKYPETGGTVPTRSHMVSRTWRYGKCPVYDVVNAKYMAQKTQSHPEGSLEKVVENLVKTWEMEATHKTDLADWETIKDHDNFRIGANNGKKFTTSDGLKIGNYNILLDDCPKDLYDNKGVDFHQSHDKFKGLFQTGFAWEVIKVFTGPPTVAFTWRHWGHAGTTTLEEEQNGGGDEVELFGAAVVKVDANLKILDVHAYFDPTEFMKKVKALEEKYPWDDSVAGSKSRVLFRKDESSRIDISLGDTISRSKAGKTI